MREGQSFLYFLFSQFHSHQLVPTYEPPAKGCQEGAQYPRLFFIAKLVPPRAQIRPFCVARLCRDLEWLSYHSPANLQIRSKRKILLR